MVSNNLNIPSIQGKKDFKVQNNQAPTMGAQGEIENPYASRMNASKDSDPRAVLGLTAASWYLMNKGMDKFNASLDKDYSETVYGKIDKFSDDVVEKITGTKNDRTFVGKISDKVGNWWKGFRTNTLEKIPLARTLLNDSADPELSPVKCQKEGLPGISKGDDHQVFEQFLEPSVELDKHGNIKKYNVRQLEQYGTWDPDFVKLTGEQYLEKELEGLNKFLPDNVQKYSFPNGATNKQKLDIINELKCKVLKIDLAKLPEKIADLDADLLDDLKKHTNLANFPEKVADLPENEMSRLMHSLERKNSTIKKEGMQRLYEAMFADPKQFLQDNKNLMDLKFSIWREEGGVLKAIKTESLGRIVTMREAVNKAFASTKGSVLTKLLAYGQECMTSRFGGGKAMALLQAYFIGDMLYQSINAPKGEKFKTFAERFTHDMTCFISIPFALMGLYKLGGLRFIGGDKAGYLKDLEAHNKMAVDGTYKSGKEVRNAYHALVKKYAPKGFFNKIFWYAGRILDMGNACGVAFQKKDGSAVANWFRRVFSRRTAKNIIGTPLRFIIPMFIISPAIAKRVVGIEHKIIGRPTHSVLDDEEPEVPQEQELSPMQQQLLQQQMMQQQMEQNQMNQQMGQQAQMAQQQMGQQQNQPSNPFNGQNPSYQQNGNVAQMQNAQQVNNQTNVQQNGKVMEPKRTYVPSPFGMVKPTQADMSQYNTAMMEADKAERLAQSVLSMH